MAKKGFIKDLNNIEILPITRGELIIDSSGNLAFHSTEFLATDSLPGLMSPEEKIKLSTIAGNTIDSILSTTSVNPVQNKVVTVAINEAKQLAIDALETANDASENVSKVLQIVNGIKESYLKSATVNGNVLTIVDLSDSEITFTNTTYNTFLKETAVNTGGRNGLVPKPDYNDNSKTRFLREDGTWVIPTYSNTTYSVVSSSANGLAPKVISTNTATVGSAYYVLASTNGSADPSWYKLPANAFNDDTKVTQTNTTGSALYRVLLSGNADDTTETTTARKSANLLFNPSTGNLKTTSLNLNGDIVINDGTNHDRFIKFQHANSDNYGWRIGYLGAQGGDNNDLTFDSHRKEAGWASALYFKHTTLDAHFAGIVHAPTFQGNLDGTYVNKLTGYKIANAIGSIAATDSLNTALGKLEFKTDFIYNDLFGTDNDDVINKWHEIVDFVDSVAEGTDITDEFVTRKTEQTITGEKIFSGTSATLLTIDRNSTNPAWIKFAKNNNLLGYIGIDNDKKPVVNIDGKVHDILHSNNSFIKDGIITINGTSITPLTSHQSLANYVTLNTALTISGIKTFSTLLKFTVAKGTAPFTVTSTTKVTNLNVDYLEGWHKDYFLIGYNGSRHYRVQFALGSENLNWRTIVKGSSTYTTAPTDKTWQASNIRGTIWFTTNNHAGGLIIKIPFNAVFYYVSSTSLVNNAYIWVPQHAKQYDIIRIVRISTNNFELQVRQDANHRNGWIDYLVWTYGNTSLTAYDSLETASSGTVVVSASNASILTEDTAAVAYKVNNALTFAAGAFAAKTYNGSAAVTVNVPTKTSHLTNDSGFITSAAVDDKLANYVTLDTDQTITGLKTFLSISSTTGISLVLKNKGWTGNMSTAMDFYNGKDYKVPNARIETKMVGSGTAGGTLIFYTQTEHASTNPNPNGLTERLRIGDDGTTKVTGKLTVTTSVETPLVSSTGRLTLNATSIALDLKFNNDNAKSVILNGTEFKPFDAADGKLDLGASDSRWKGIYGGTGNFIGSVESIITTSDAVKHAVTNANGSVELLVHSNRGLYDRTKSKWIIYVPNGTSKVYVPTWGSIGNSTTPVYFNANGEPTACTSYTSALDDRYVNVTGDTMTGRLNMNTTIVDHNKPTDQCLVINSTAIPEGTTLTLKNSPGIGFHIASSTWGSLVFNGKFNFINNTADGYMDVNLKALSASTVINANSHRFNYGLAYYNTTTSTVTGTIVITLPNGWNSSMNTYEIDIYEYTDYDELAANILHSKIIISGYNYSTNTQWFKYGYQQIGSYNKGVRLGYNGSKCCILLGTTTTKWSYPQVHLSRVITGFGKETEWSSGYSISVITSESGYSKIVTASRTRQYFADVVANNFRGTLITGSSLYLTLDTPKYGINLNNSDIIGTNSIYFYDKVDGASEGLRFYRDGTKWDTLTAASGVVYFNPNSELSGGTLTPLFSALNNVNNTDHPLSIYATIGGTTRYLKVLYSQAAVYLILNTVTSPNNVYTSSPLVKWHTLPSTDPGTAGYAGNNYGFPVNNNANGILWLGTHTGPYGGQLGISSNGKIYYRFINNNSFPTTADGGSWNRVAWASEVNALKDYYWADIKISSSKNAATTPTFASAKMTNYAFMNPSGEGIYLDTSHIRWHNKCSYAKELLTFTADGYVGVGITAPTVRLQVGGSARADRFYLNYGGASGVNYADLLIGTRGTACTTAGTAGTTGITYLSLGNDTAVSSTAGSGADNARGILRIYGTSTGYTNIQTGTNNGSGYTLYLPGATGLFVYHENNTLIGGTHIPVYITAGGAATACTIEDGSGTVDRKLLVTNGSNGIYSIATITGNYATGTIVSSVSSTTDVRHTCTNSNGSVSLYASTNRGLYDTTNGAWIIYLKNADNHVYVPKWASKGSATLPVYFNSSGEPVACTSYASAITWTAADYTTAKVGTLTIAGTAKPIYDMFILGLGSAIANNTDLDTIKSPSVYYSSSSSVSATLTNAPWTSSGFRLVTLTGYDSASSYGVLLAHSSQHFFWRLMGASNTDPSSWYSWVKFAFGTAVGGSTTPIYLTSSGVPTAGTSYAKAIKSITRSGTTFTYTCIDGTTGTFTQLDNNTDTKVTNTLATTTKFYLTGTSSATTNTGTLYFDTGIYTSTTAGALYATKMYSSYYCNTVGALSYATASSGWTGADIECIVAGSASYPTILRSSGDNFYHYNDSAKAKYLVCDKYNTTWTASLTSGTAIGTLKIGGSSYTLYCQTNTNTDTKVTLSLTTTASYRPLVLGYASGTAGSTDLYATNTNVVYTTHKMYVLPSTGYIYAVHYYESSDATLKTNIKSISDTDNIPTLREFNWKETGKHSYGFIAQELELQGYSELVDGEEGHKTVNYTAALALTVGKLQNKIKELEKEIENLKNKN